MEKVQLTESVEQWAVPSDCYQTGDNIYLQHLFCFTGKSLKNFAPVYPMKLKIDLQTFCHAFPFHVVFDEQVKFTEIYIV